MSLPVEFTKFLEQTAARSDELFQPDWLLDNPAAMNWRVISGNDARKVSGKWKGISHITWEMTLPGGHLTDPEYQLLVRHSQLLVLNAFTGYRATAMPVQLAAFHGRLMNVLEFLVLSDKARAREAGILAFDLDMAREFIARYREGGRVETGALVARWDQWLNGVLTVDELSRLEAWLSGQTPAIRNAILDVSRKVDSYEPSGTPAFKSTFDPSKLPLARAYLHLANAFDRDGLIRQGYVADSIQVDRVRLSSTPRLAYHLRQFELCTDYRSKEFPSYSKISEPAVGMRTIGQRAEAHVSTASACGFLYRLGESAWSVECLRHWALADLPALRQELAAFDRHPAGGRTRTVPLSTAKSLLGQCMQWLHEVGPSLVALVAATSEEAARDANSPAWEALEEALKRVDIPNELRGHKIRGFWPRPIPDRGHSLRNEAGGSSAVASIREQGIFVSEMIELHATICFITVTLLCCSRVSEVVAVQDSDLTEVRGFWYLDVELRKNIVAGIRKRMRKPVPPLVCQCIRSMQSIRATLKVLIKPDDALAAKRPFFTVKRFAGLQPMTKNCVYTQLQFVSEYFDLRSPKGVRWSIRPHELRRLFAMTFFHSSGQENSLPALSWFMGHREIAETWRYIKEELTGSEISATEALLAAHALSSPEQTSGSNKLRALLTKHFGVETLATLDEEELLDYLEYLNEKSVFSAEPVEVRTMGNVRYAVLIHIHGGDRDAMVEQGRAGRKRP